MNISPKTVETLRKHGWDVIRVSQRLPVQASDRDILDFARRESRAIITQDLDFSALLAVEGHDRPSVITLRLSVSNPDTVARRLLQVLSRFEREIEEGCAITVEDLVVRVRRLPIE